MTTSTKLSDGPGTPAPVETEGPAADVPLAVAAQSLRDYMGAWFARVRQGDSGVLPVVAGLLLITVIFQTVSPHNIFLSAGNLVNLFQQSAVFMVLAMAETFVLLLGEIDLSIGFAGAVGAAIGVQLVQPVTTNWQWWAAIAGALLACALIGLIQGSIITRLHIPSFVVTLAGSVILNGVMLIILLLGPFSGYPSLAGLSNNLQVLYDLMWQNVPADWSWYATIVLVAALVAMQWWRDTRRRRSGLVAPPVSLTALKSLTLAAAGLAVVVICGINRGRLIVVEGIPWVIPIVLGVYLAWSTLLQRTRFGRYVYAIGGNPEAARRAGINLARVRTLAFVLCSFTAGIAGLLYASYLGGMSNNVAGGQMTLYAVAAAVIGGTSLFGGRGRVLHGILGGLVIGGIYNGMYLLGFDVQWTFIVTGIVLIVSVAIDSLSRRGATTGSVAHV